MKESIILITRGYASERPSERRADEEAERQRERGLRERERDGKGGKKAEENAPFSGDHFNSCPLLSSFPTPKDKPERKTVGVNWVGAGVH